ncbi:ZIP zinc transporter-domain-containing protein [Aspergillus spectabilis]
MRIILSVLAVTGLVRAVSITDCHKHGDDVYCVTPDGGEVQVLLEDTSSNPPSEFTDCHSHGDTSYCVDADGNDVEVVGDIGSDTDSATTDSATTDDSVSITDCHKHDEDVYCIAPDGGEVQVLLEDTTGDPPSEFTDCHAHGETSYCVDANGSDVEVVGDLGLATGSTTEEEPASEESSEGENCHFHAGVEHCVGAGESESGGSSAPSCGIQSRDYDIPLRIGTLFVVLVTSSIGVFLPMALVKLPSATINVWASTIIKQFGTGVILSTAFVHLYTHADLMFSNDCLGSLEYEATTSAVVMAGIFLSFLTEYLGHRYIMARAARAARASAEQPQTVDNSSNVSSKSPADQAPQPHQHGTLASLGHHHGGDPTNPNTKLSVLVMEAGVLFHSILIGVTLVVAGDSFYKTLLVVIVFHQFFEGLALGARIATLPGRTFPTKAIMGGVFAIITPIGMAIGMGVIHSFNGQDRETLIALGTLDALSAGILVWVGVVDMWARDWVIEGGDMLNAPVGHVTAGGLSLVAGMVLMGVLAIHYDGSYDKVLCTNGLQADVEGHIGMDLDIEGALPGWKNGATNLFSYGPTSLFSDCIPFDTLLGRSLQERASLSPIPDADTATCAVSVSGVYCADPDGDRDPDPDCDLRDLPDRKYPVTRRDLSWVDEEEDASQTPNDNNEVTPMINVLEKRTIKKLRYCDLPKTKDRWKKHERTYSGLLWFPDNPPSTTLVARYPNVATYDAADFLDCKNFDLARISTPTNPFEKSLNGGRRYETEHILEGQALQQFFITYSRRWSDRKEADKYANPNARYFRSPKASDDSELTWCEYMKLWWDIQSPANTRVCLAYPGLTAKEHDGEYWYKRVASYHTGYIDDNFQARDWGNVARTIKMQILNWKYYSEYESNRVILAKQARRVTEKLEELEGNGPESIQQTVTPPSSSGRVSEEVRRLYYSRSDELPATRR